MRELQTRHGTYVMYANDCRCTRCCDYQNQRNARNRAARLASGNLTHGTRSAYDAGCRCEPCREAKREAYERLDSRCPRSPEYQRRTS